MAEKIKGSEKPIEKELRFEPNIVLKAILEKNYLTVTIMVDGKPRVNSYYPVGSLQRWKDSESETDTTEDI
jgi:hypothetical protein